MLREIAVSATKGFDGRIEIDPVRSFRHKRSASRTFARHVNARPISGCDCEHDLAFGVTFLDIVER
jgi:hypothetical protein